jgi:hypothetical protein
MRRIEEEARFGGLSFGMFEVEGIATATGHLEN